MRSAGIRRVRSAYRHGDLREALVEAGIELAREGGPAAVVLREATRRVGVVPNAAYRHFSSRDELFWAVRARALAAVAVAMQARLDRVKRVRDPARTARARLRAVGESYLRFAIEETGLFRTAFSVAAPQTPEAVAAASGREDSNPFVLLGSVLDELVQSGALARNRRKGAEYLAWSAVHGLAMLVIEGPLHAFDAQQLHLVGQRVLDMVEKGLT